LSNKLKIIISFIFIFININLVYRVVQLKKRVGLGVAPSRETAKMSLNKFQTEVKEYIMRFSIGPKIKLSFTTEFTKDERKIIHK